MRKIAPKQIFTLSPLSKLVSLRQRRLGQVVLVAALFSVLSCSRVAPRESIDVTTVEATGKEFVASSPELERLFKDSPKAVSQTFRFEVFVDQSASMRGYVDFARNWDTGVRKAANKSPIDNIPSTSPFIQLMRQFGNEGELLAYYGFGSKTLSSR